jgi:hypothetical protein
MTDLDVLGEQAAQALRRASQVDGDARLVDLHRTRRRRTRHRSAALLAGLAVVAVAGWSLRPDGGAGRTGPEPAPATSPSTSPSTRVAPGETELDRARSPRGGDEVVAVLRAGQNAVVRVEPGSSDEQHVVWSAPTAHEQGDRNLPWPAAVVWAPDASRLAILVAQERGAVDTTDDLVDLTLVTVRPDGSGRQVVGTVGTCWCADGPPDLSWVRSGQVEVLVPDGPDRGTQRRTLP